MDSESKEGTVTGGRKNQTAGKAGRIWPELFWRRIQKLYSP